MNENNPDKRTISSSFCILPWILFYSAPNGKVGPCCAAKDIYKPDGSSCNIRYEDPAQIWNGETSKAIRQELLNGQKPDLCSTCYDHESKGMESHRRNMNRLFFDEDADRDIYSITKFKERLVDPDNDLLTSKLPLFFDLRLGNLCNLKCRMCYPFASSQIEKEKVSKLWSGVDLDFESGKTVEDWPEAINLMQNLNDFTIEAVRLEIAGGEPSINKSQIELLQNFVDRGQAENMHLQVTTNFTNISERFYNLVDHFKTVVLFISLDGIGDVNDYIRSPVKWAVTSNNVMAIQKKYPHFNLHVLPTYQAYNILYATFLWDWCFVQNVTVSTMNTLLNPTHLRYHVLPEEARLLAADRMESWIQANRERTPEYMQRNIAGMMSDLRDMSNTASEEDVMNFVKYTNDLDLERGEDIRKSLPELYEIWRRHRGWDHDLIKHYSPPEPQEQLSA